MRYRIPLDAKFHYAHERPLEWIIATPTRGKLCCPLVFVVYDSPGAWQRRVRYHGDTAHLHTVQGDVTIRALITRLEGNIYAALND